MALRRRIPALQPSGLRWGGDRPELHHHREVIRVTVMTFRRQTTILTGPLMRTTIDVLAVLAIVANAVVYGTDVFGAIVLRPALAAVDDRVLTQLLGPVHHVADRRFPAIGAGGLLAAVAMTALAAAGGQWVSNGAGGIATLARLGFLGVYARMR
jgi:hypothetical protein